MAGNIIDNKENNRVKNDSGDHHYFTQTPRIVWALSRTPFDLALWQTVKDIAGENGECYISTPDLAVLAMMSVGQCHESRAYLMDCGLLKGEKRKDPGYPLEVWHLSIPDLWEKSTAWSASHKSIYTRIAYKSAQRAALVIQRKKVRAEKEKKEGHSPAERSGHSPAERGHSPAEKPLPPAEIKNIKQEEPKEDGGKAAPPAAWELGWQLAAGVETVTLPNEEELFQAKVANAVELFPQEHKELVRAFVIASGIYPIKDDVSKWCMALRDQKARTGLSAENIIQACQKMFADGLTVKDILSVVGVAGGLRTAAAHRPNPIVPTPIKADDWRKGIRL